MEAAGSFETLHPVFQTARPHIPEYCNRYVSVSVIMIIFGDVILPQPIDAMSGMWNIAV
jgi:hypothetical protein